MGARVGFGCRDCRTCTMNGVARTGMVWTMGLLHLSTASLSWLVKRGFWRHCPNCRHMLSRHVAPLPTVNINR